MIPIDRPSIRRRDMDSVLTCMVNDSLGPGDRNNELVSAVSHHLGIAGGIALRERGRALSLALGLIDPPTGSRVAMDPLVPSYYHDIVVAEGLVPVYVDIASDGTCIDPRVLEKLVAEDQSEDEDPVQTDPSAATATASGGDADGGVATQHESGRLAAIITHTALGYVPDMETIAALGIPVIEDISEGIGANTGDRLAGSYGKVVIVGMEPDGIITAGGGTLLLALTKADAGRLQRAADALPPDTLLPDMNAALGLTQIKELERFVTRRAELAAVFSRAVMRGRHTVPGQPGDAQNVHHAFPVVLAAGTAEVREYARKKGVETAMAFGESVLARYANPAARADDGEPSPEGVINEDDFPAARALCLRCIRFPLYPALTGKETTTIERVLSTLP
jgi:dTDP-4-amino-4,6-dideoxygalactose transaminase